MQTFITLSLETQGLGIIFNALTRGTLSITQGAIVGGIIGLAYVIVAGMKEMGAVNVINSVVMYIALIAAALCLGGIVPGGWDSFTEYFVSSGQAQALSFWGTPSTFFAFAINNILALTFAQGISQMGLQPGHGRQGRAPHQEGPVALRSHQRRVWPADHGHRHGWPSTWWKPARWSCPPSTPRTPALCSWLSTSLAG